MSKTKFEQAAESFVKSKIHERDPYCEPGYCHPMRKGFNAGYEYGKNEERERAEKLLKALSSYHLHNCDETDNSRICKSCEAINEHEGDI